MLGLEKVGAKIIREVREERGEAYVGCDIRGTFFGAVSRLVG